jgi:transposase InsO family protein
VFKEISKMEQRYDAVLMVIKDGYSVSEVALKVKVSRQTLYKWLADYEASGLQGLDDRSHRPHHVPHQLDGAREAAIIAVRLAHPRWGPVRIAHELERTGMAPPALMTIHRVLARRGLIAPRAERKKLPTYKRWERGRPMELWQMDVVGGVLTTGGVEAKILTGIDDHSRFIVCAGVMARATLRPVCAHLASALERHGVPDEILTDNGKVFTNRFGKGDAETLFDRICRENGITHRLTAPRSPTTTGKIERFHRTLREEFLTGRVFESLVTAQHELDDFITLYNTQRPHQGIAMVTPASRFYAREESLPGVALVISDPRASHAGLEWVARTVNINGVVTVSGQAFSVGKHRCGRVIDVKVSERTLEVWDGSELVKAVKRLTTGEVRKKKAESRERS